jgi:hypothetical protein
MPPDPVLAANTRDWLDPPMEEAEQALKIAASFAADIAAYFPPELAVPAGVFGPKSQPKL